MSCDGTCQGTPAGNARVVSASRRTDLPARFPEWLAAVIAAGRAEVLGPAGRARTVDLRPEAVHTFVLWSKDFSAVLDDRASLRTLLGRYDQLYFLFTVTGLGRTRVEPRVPAPRATLDEVPRLVELAGNPRRVSLRFDPVVFWEEGGRTRSNAGFFEELAPAAAANGVRDIRFSIAQWYGKARRRAARLGFPYVDPPLEVKLEAAAGLARTAAAFGLSLLSCSQDFLAEIPGIGRSSCIDGRLLTELHPRREPASGRKDRTQRPECGCTESVDIGSYTQSCPHACVYCYANPRIGDQAEAVRPGPGARFPAPISRPSPGGGAGR